jgi:hypothetical protein
MTANDAEAQEVHATVTDPGPAREPDDGDQAHRPDVLDGEVVDDEDVDDEDEDGEDVVVIEGMSVVRADGDASPVSAADGVSPPDADDAVSPPDADDDVSPLDADDAVSPVDADDDVSPLDADDDASSTEADDQPARDQVISTPAATTSPDTARPGMPVGAGTPAGTGGTPAAAGMPSDTDVPADTNMAGDPETLHQQWAAIQSTFVDDPRGSVAAAAEFLTETIAALVASLQERENALRGEWDRDGVDTEGLRNALRSYRGLLDQLVRR